MKDLRVSLPDDTYTALVAEANLHGFIGRYGASGYIRHLACEAVGMNLRAIEPIVVRVPTIEQRRDYEAYAIAKGRASVEAWAAEALATERNRNLLTARQQAVFDQTHAFLVDPAKALEL